VTRARVRWLAAAGAIVAAAFAAAAWGAGTALVIAAPVGSPDVIVSLASHEWERLPAAAARARRYPQAVLLLTVPERVTVHNCHDCAHRAERLIADGVVGSRIRSVRLTQGGTYGEAVATRAFVTAHHLTSVLVVTSPYHTRRALATFRTVLGPRIAIGIAPATATSPARPAWWWMSGYDRAYVGYEWAATVYYRFRHGVPVGL
jgi:uncharacterized SAM-binding protein YcdF (DUF218 family)